jgi:hypothetical protein
VPNDYIYWNFLSCASDRGEEDAWNNKPSVRRNQHGHEYDDNPLPPVKPKAPEVRKTPPVNSNPSAPSGPPIGSGHHHHAPPPYSPPPAYNPSYSAPPSYSSGYNQPKFGQAPYSQPGGFNNYQPGGYNQFSSPGMSPMGGMPVMGVMPMAASPYGYGSRSSGMGSGIMTNLFAGLAGYQLAKAFSGGSHYHNRDREIIVIDNRSQTPAPVQAVNTGQAQVQPPQTQTYAAQPPPESHHSHQYSTEIPQIPPTQVVPTMNEYNYWGFPQYGIPLYGYSLPSQITDYYQSAVISKPPE